MGREQEGEIGEGSRLTDEDSGAATGGDEAESESAIGPLRFRFG